MSNYTVLEHFDALTKHGIKVIPLRENSKAPMCKGWNRDWDRDMCRARLQRFPEANIGILLGDIVDVEGDNQESNRELLDLIGDYPHPTYHSNRSTHHLFQSPDNKLRLLKVGKLEFRGYGHQSVLPPSQCAGIEYKWLKEFRFPIPEMPKQLFIFYEKNKLGFKHRNKILVKPGHMQVWCSECREKCYLHKKRFKLELEAFQILGLYWQCWGCRLVDLRPACRLIRKGVSREDVLLNSFPQL